MVLAVSGCIFKWHKAAATPPAATSSKMIVTPDLSQAAKVVDVNTVGRFVILNFPAGQMPKPQQTFFLYRHGLKVGEVRITGPKDQNNIVADIVTGNAKVGDAVRNE